MSFWRVVVDFCMPPPLILTALLIIPTPRAVSKLLLAFAQNVLFLKVIDRIKLVHFVLCVTGLMMIGAAVHTHTLRQSVDPGLSANQRTAVMARIWREERNFWISVLTFVLWGLLYRFYALMMAHLELKDKVAALEMQLYGPGGGGGGGGIKAGGKGSTKRYGDDDPKKSAGFDDPKKTAGSVAADIAGVPPRRAEVPSAPPAADAELRQRTKGKAAS